ncbi:MAG: ATP synthase subunit I [Nocardioidaceae bacterium]
MTESPVLLRAVANQKRAILLAVAVAVVACWFGIAFGHWAVGVFLAIGIMLSLVNHVLTELSLLRSVQSGDLLTRKQFAMSSLVRLMAISLCAVAIAVVFWPDGLAVFFGLAIFHFITLVFTGFPLLKEIKKA